MKRQETLRSFSSRREAAATAPENHHAKAVGCMSGIFQLVSSKYRTRRKFLTFGRKQGKEAVVVVPAKPKSDTENSPSTVAKTNQEDDKKSDKDGGKVTHRHHVQRLSCDVPRSPTIQSEIRRSNSLNSPENYRTPPALVARLMGLDEAPAATTSESAAEKRRKLLTALEKCDEDLKTLKRIIEAVREAEPSRTPPVTVNRDGGGSIRSKTAKSTAIEAVCAAEPSRTPPVTVRSDTAKSTAIQAVCVTEPPRSPPITVNLDGGSSIRPETAKCTVIKTCVNYNEEKELRADFEEKTKSLCPIVKEEERNGGGMPEKWPEIGAEQPSPVSVLDDITRSPPLSSGHWLITNGRVQVLNQQTQQQETKPKRPGEDENVPTFYFLDKSPKPWRPPNQQNSTITSSQYNNNNSSSSSMAQSIKEVCEDIAWGQRREVRRIGLMIQDHIFRDLIDEFAMEMGSCFIYSMHFDHSCKRKLPF